ncbi:MAG: dependent ligase, partial [Pseudonocardia sp.]|nr:dependent ligase [Pseudonocardia sp.]
MTALRERPSGVLTRMARRTASAAPRWVPPSEEELAALDALGSAGGWTLQGRELRLTNLDKVLFPASATAPEVTKRDLIRYHAVIAPF